MDVIAHKNIAVKPKSPPRLYIPDDIEVFPEIFLPRKDLLPLVSPHNDMVYAAFKLYSRFPSHGIKMPYGGTQVNFLSLTRCFSYG